MPRCSFCKEQYEFPKGTTVVQKDGNPKHFCSKKCRRGDEMGRDNRKVNWIRKKKEETSEIVTEEAEEDKKE